MILDINILLTSFFLIFINYLILLNRKLIAEKLKIYDYPNNRKIHKTPTPLIGGLCIFVSLIILNFIFYFTNSVEIKNFFILIFIYSLFFFIGLWDDIKNLSPKIRTLLILIVITSLLLLDENYLIEELRFKYSEIIIELNYFSIIFTAFCFFALYNALNFIDGYNGIAITISIYWCSFLFTKNNNLIYFFIFLILFLICLYNLYGKLFLGNSGTSILSIFFSLSLTADYNLSRTIYSDEILFILFFPGIDMIRVTLGRIINRKKIYNPDKSHFHHYLLYNNYKYIWQTMIFLTLLPLILLEITKNTSVTLIISILIYITIFSLLKKKSNYIKKIK